MFFYIGPGRHDVCKFVNFKLESVSNPWPEEVSRYLRPVFIGSTQKYLVITKDGNLTKAKEYYFKRRKYEPHGPREKVAFLPKVKESEDGDHVRTIYFLSKESLQIDYCVTLILEYFFEKSKMNRNNKKWQLLLVKVMVTKKI